MLLTGGQRLTAVPAVGKTSELPGRGVTFIGNFGQYGGDLEVHSCYVFEEHSDS